MPTAGHVVLTYHTDGCLLAHGTYATPTLARTASAEIGFTDPTVAASTVAALLPPESNDLDTALEHHTLAPDRILHDLTEAPLPEHGQVVILIADPIRSRFVLVGPFPDKTTSRSWLHSHRPHNPAVRHHLLALREQTPPHPDHDTTPRVITVTTPIGRFAYGPFPDALHATAWAHPFAVALDPQHHRIAVYPVGTPFDLNGDAPTRTPAPIAAATVGQPATYAQHTHVVLVHDDRDESGLVGFFADLDEATAWCASQLPALDTTVVLTAMALLAPFTFPTPPTR
jgi:hypothetical protein